MVIDEILKKKNMSRYKLSKLSGVPQTTISDLCNGKTSLMNSSVGTVYKIAHAFDIKIDDLVEIEVDRIDYENCNFENFKSYICHSVKEKGDLTFILDTINSKEIEHYYRAKHYLEAFYLLGMVDYLSNENDIPLYENYNTLRTQKLDKVIYPISLLMEVAVTKNESLKEEAYENAIPEFKRFNIVENEVRNVI